MITRRAFARSVALGASLTLVRAPRAGGARQALPEIRRRMQWFVDEGVVAGAVTMVGFRGEVVHLEAVGQRDLATRRPMRSDSIFRIASMTKPMTALALMMLVEEGRLALADPVEKHLPELRGLWVAKSGTESERVLGRPARPPTIEDLLRHTSGMAALPPPGLAELYGRRHRTLAEAVMAYAQRPLEFEPGTRWRYSNTGIDTAGRVVEVLAGKSFERFLKERLFDPLGMMDTWFFAPRGRAAERVATLYAGKDGRLERVSSWLGGDEGGVFPLPAGGLFSTAQDLGRLHQALVDGGRHARGRLVEPETLAQMTRSHTGDLPAGFGPGMTFGLGFGVVREPREAAAALSPGSFGHGGAFGTQGWVDPVMKMYFILLIQRRDTPGGDQSALRRELQSLAVAGLAG